MKPRRRVLPGPGWILGLIAAILIPAAEAFAQRDELPVAMLGGLMLFFVFIGAGFYIYFSLALMTIAKKTGTENGWFAWIPILNVILMLSIAKKPIWWIILFLIPLANIVVAILVWMGVAEARNKPNWWGILMIVPIVNIIVPGYLAWSD